MNERDGKPEERPEEAEASETVDDLDVPEGEAEDVKGGAEPVHNYSFKQAWPTKYSG